MVFGKVTKQASPLEIPILKTFYLKPLETQNFLCWPTFHVGYVLNFDSIEKKQGVKFLYGKHISTMLLSMVIY